MKPTSHRSLLVFLILLVLLSSGCTAVNGPLPAGGESAPVDETGTQATIEVLLTEGAAPRATDETEGTATAAAVSTQAASTQIAATIAQAAAAATATAVEAATATAAAAAAPTVTAISVPTAVPTPTSAPTSAPTSTTAPAFPLPAGLEVFRHPDMPGFVFLADPTVWKLGDRNVWRWMFLVHRENPYCGINAVSASRTIGEPLRLQRWQLGRLRWRILDYGPDALARVDKPKGLYVELFEFDKERCRAAQQKVLEWVMLEDELSGKVAYNPLPTPTVRPPLPGFSCPNTPPVRLRVDDHAWIVTNDLLLRSQPRPDSSTRIRAYDRTDPVLVQVVGGPVCTEKFVYWKVRVSQISDNYIKPLEGWMAEGDLSEYYLEPTDI